jgi:lysophospholipase L1-like esterase
MAKKKLQVSDDFNPIWDIKNEGRPVANLDANNKGYDCYIESLHYTVHCTDNLPIQVVLQIGDSNQNLGQLAYSYVTVPNGAYTIPINRLIRMGSTEIKIQVPNTGINAGRTISSGYYVVGQQIPQLSQFDEDNVIYSLGDSIDVLNAYVTRVCGHRNYQMLTELRKSGYDCRLASLAISGKSLNQFVEYFKQGYGQIRKASVILVQMGVNDVGQGVSNSTFATNLDYMKTWRNSLYPDAKLVICKGSPSNEISTYPDSVSRNNVQRGFNTQIDNFISSNVGNNIYMIDVFNNFPQNPSLFTDQVHPTQAGHDIMGTILTNGMKSILGIV